jgi:hypothetical protein
MTTRKTRATARAKERSISLGMTAIKAAATAEKVTARALLFGCKDRGGGGVLEFWRSSNGGWR